MIGSFWNLCRACPSMPVDKLHSEYRSTYRWHEYTGSRQDVVRRPPQPKTTTITGENQIFQNEKIQTVRLNEEDGETEGTGCKMEPAMPRRKKHPELAYKTHEFISYDDEGSSDSIDASVRADRARSEERAGYHLRPSRRSRSEGPPRGPPMNSISFREENMRRRDSDPDLEIMDSGGLLRKAISRISTEYRLQFAWPQGHNSRVNSHKPKDGSLPKKSLSMSAIKPSTQAMVHKKRNELDTKDVSELEPLVNDVGVSEEISKDDKTHPKNFRADYTKKKFQPFSQYDRNEQEGRMSTRDAEQEMLIGKSENGPNIVLYPKPNAGWYKEAVELRKKAGEYKHRGWGTDFIPEHISELYNKQIEVWDQVSRRSSLSALSLASTVHRSYTKEEKEQENNKRNSPTKVCNDKSLMQGKSRDSVDNSSKAIKDMIRHHLERTTGGSEYDGLILSPTREKLEPTIPKKNEETKAKDSHSQKSSPKKDSSQKSTANKKNIQKGNSKSTLRTIRSQSVGPTDVMEKRSPKRLSRSTTVKQHKSARESGNSPPSSNTTRRPRPSSLNTTASSRSKCNSVPIKNATSEDHLPKTKTNKSMKDNRTGTPVHVREKLNKPSAVPSTCDKSNSAKDLASTEAPISITSETEETNIDRVVKSPPEPTRVKSPEQIMMRSPDPVNWTVPLDTGKTFTVTQNVREGELMNRPHSEVKAWTPPDVPPPAAQSAPPELAEQAKAQACKMTENSITSIPSLQEEYTSSDSEFTIANRDTLEARPHKSSISVPSTVDEHTGTKSGATEMRESEPVGTKHVEAPVVAPPIAPTNRTLASEVLEKARTRFDMFWGKSKPDSEDG